MARVEIRIPESKPVFKISYTLRVSDMNYGNHLSNDKVLAYAQQARVDFFDSLGYSELDFFGESLIQGDAAIRYLSEGFLGDEIEVTLYIGDKSRVSFDLVYSYYNKTTQKDLAIVKTGLIFFDYTLRKVKGMPEGFKQKF